MQDEELGLGFIFKWPASAQQFVDSYGQRVLIDTAVERFPHNQFRCHILGCAKYHPGTAHRGFRLRFVRRGSQHLGHAEITEKRLSFGIEQNITRLDVSVNVFLSVDIVERLGD